MGLIIQYLNSSRQFILNDLVTADLKAASYYRSQGQIKTIDDILGLPEFLVSYKHPAEEVK